MSKKIDKINKKAIKLLLKSGYKQPFQLLVDDTFIIKMNKYTKRYKHLTDIFKVEPKLYFTKCIYNKYKMEEMQFTNDLSEHCEIIECKHKNKSDVEKCLNFIFRKYNKNHYILATASKMLMDKYNERGDISILNFNKGQIRLFIDTDALRIRSEHITEASPQELERLKNIFENDLEIESEEIEEVNLNDLEVSDEYEQEMKENAEQIKDTSKTYKNDVRQNNDSESEIMESINNEE